MNDEIHRHDLGDLGPQLGKGGQAVVYLAPALRLPDATGPLVYKEYRQNQVAPHGLHAIVAVRGRLTRRQRDRLDGLVAWPLRVVRDGTGIRGVVLPLIPDSFFQERVLPSGKPSRDPRDIQYLFVDPSRAVRLGMPLMSLADRLAVCRDLALALALLHEYGVVFGDVNAKNVLFRKHPEPAVMLVDCDAARIKGSAPVVRQLSAPDWEPPEGSVLTQETDMYKFGLVILRVLTPGSQASTARDPNRVVDPLLDTEGRHLLHATLSPEPRTRPSAKTWRRYLALRLGHRPPGSDPA
jgi:DNA-binding helix-hairpin-helix protein with protein kinase domain